MSTEISFLQTIFAGVLVFESIKRSMNDSFRMKTKKEN